MVKGHGGITDIQNTDCLIIGVCGQPRWSDRAELIIGKCSEQTAEDDHGYGQHTVIHGSTLLIFVCCQPLGRHGNGSRLAVCIR